MIRRPASEGNDVTAKGTKPDIDRPVIRVLIPYFGSWPSWLPFYLEGCRVNPFVEVVIFTDCPFPKDYPRNVTFVESTLADVADRVQVRTGIPLQLRNAYKLCDLKPMYGFLFDDYLDGADYWGFGDIDLMYGRLSDYLSPVLERNADILSIRKEYVSGGFTLIRNCKELRELFRDSPDWRRVLGTESYLSFDECGFAWDALRAGYSIWEVETNIVSFTEVVFNAIRQGKVTGSFESTELCIIPGNARVSSRGVLAGRTRYSLVHLNHYKNRWYFTVPRWSSVPETYLVSVRGIFKSHHASFASQIIHRNWQETLERLWVRAMEYVGKKRFSIRKGL